MIRVSTSLACCTLLLSPTAGAQFEFDLTAPETSPKPKKELNAVPKAVEQEFDLSDTADVKKTLLLPVIVRVTQSHGGGFSGLDTKKTVEKFDLSSHKRFVASLAARIGDKAVSAEQSQSVMTSEALTVALARTASGIARVAAASNVANVVLLELSRGTLVATVYDASGESVGKAVSVSNAGSLTQKNADELGDSLTATLAELQKQAAAPVAAVPAPTVEPPTKLEAPEEDVYDPPEPPPAVKEQSVSWSPDADRPRVVVAVGAGAVTRDFSAGGTAASQLAQLKSATVLGIGVYAHVQPLQFFDSTAGKRWSDLGLELNFRRAIVKAVGLEGPVAGTSCAVSDDDLQVRGTYRFKVLDHSYAPKVGLGLGWSQERTVFEQCTLPLVSAAYGGLDAQLRVHQPLYGRVLALDAALGPRFLVGSTSSKLSFGGEAWLELKPASVFFIRGGFRGSRLSADLTNLALAETRFFISLEAGAFF